MEKKSACPNKLLKNSFTKKEKIIFCVVLVGLLVCIGVVSATWYQVTAPHQITNEGVLAQRSVENLKLFEFQLDNTNYQVPSSWQSFAKNEWVLSDNPVLTAGMSVPIAAQKGSEVIYLNIKNTSSETKNASDCMVSQITVQSNQDESKNPIFFGIGGLSLRQDYDQMKEALGVYDAASKSGDMYTYTYYYGSNAAIEIQLKGSEGIQSIKLNRWTTES